MVGIEVSAGRAPHEVERILRLLPQWFGIEASVADYVEAASDERFGSYLASVQGAVVGIALVRRHFTESAELHLIAVDPEARGSGVGRALVERIDTDLSDDGCRMLTVHTVGPSFDHEPYAQTRAFYAALGFIPLEELEGVGWDGPTLILVRPVDSICRLGTE